MLSLNCFTANNKPIIRNIFDFQSLIIAKANLPDAPLIPTQHHQDVCNTIWQILNDFAYQTYVPATDKSRLSGAGAGLVDND